MSSLPTGQKIEVSGVNTNGEFVTNTFEANKTYTYNGKETSGKTIIANYYQDIYPNETANFMTKVNALRLRTISLSYNLPKNVTCQNKSYKTCLNYGNG